MNTCKLNALREEVTIITSIKLCQVGLHMYHTQFTPYSIVKVLLENYISSARLNKEVNFFPVKYTRN